MRGTRENPQASKECHLTLSPQAGPGWHLLRPAGVRRRRQPARCEIRFRALRNVVPRGVGCTGMRRRGGALQTRAIKRGLIGIGIALLSAWLLHATPVKPGKITKIPQFR